MRQGLTSILSNKAKPLPSSLINSIAKGSLLNPSKKLGLPLRLSLQNLVYCTRKVLNSHQSIPLFLPTVDAVPIISTKTNFDNLLVPKDHITRNKSNSFFIDEHQVLCTHATAFYEDIVRKSPNIKQFIVAGDIYRKDAVDKSHFPIFHQVDVVNLFEDCENVQEEMIIEHLKQNITKILKTFFKNSPIEVNWNYDSFPFTKPSFEVEIIKKESEGIKKYEVGGCGRLQPRVLSNIGSQYSKGWAIGFGLDRLAMLYYDIPDIRILWSAKSEVLDQFSKLEFTDCYQYKDVSNFPSAKRDLSFWISSLYYFDEEKFFHLLQEASGHLIVKIELIDEYRDKCSEEISKTYRIFYNHSSSTLDNITINDMHKNLSEQVQKKFNIKIRS